MRILADGPTNKPVLKISELSFNYPDGHHVLKDINLNVWSGERVGIVGPNGAGKTTYFQLLCGVLKPTVGKINLFGKSVVPGEFRSEVGMIFQNSNDQLFCPAVRDDIAFGPRNLGISKEEVDARVQEAISVTGIEELSERPPHHLSGGEKRMVAIAGVLAMRPRIVIYDEPTSNLDMRYRRRLINFLKESSQEAMLISSHDLEFILEVCNRVILMDGGCIVADGSPRDILGDVALMEAHGLERPHSLVPHMENHHKKIG